MHGMGAHARREDIVARAIEAGKHEGVKQHLHSRITSNPCARFESHETVDEGRRRTRQGMRKPRLNNSRGKRSAAKPVCAARPYRKKRSAAKPASKQEKRIRRNSPQLLWTTL